VERSKKTGKNQYRTAKVIKATYSNKRLRPAFGRKSLHIYRCAWKNKFSMKLAL
jgi:hypothetical protein